jgi:hypothetical protein
MAPMMLPAMLLMLVFVELITMRGMIPPVFLHDDRRYRMPIHAVGDRERRWGRIHHARIHDARRWLDDDRRRVDNDGRGSDIHR